MSDNIQIFFTVLVANFEFAPKQKYTAWTFSMETVLRTNQSAQISLINKSLVLSNELINVELPP